MTQHVPHTTSTPAPVTRPKKVRLTVMNTRGDSITMDIADALDHYSTEVVEEMVTRGTYAGILEDSPAAWTIIKQSNVYFRSVDDQQAQQYLASRQAGLQHEDHNLLLPKGPQCPCL